MRRRFLAAVAAGLAATTTATAQSQPSPPGPISYVATDPGPTPAARPAARPAAPPCVASAVLADSAADAVGPRFWATGEYLIWYTRNQASPPLVVSVPNQFVQLGNQLPAGTTRNLYPSQRKIEFDAQSGVRVQVGGSLGPNLGFDVGGFVLESKSDGGFFASPGSPSLARVYVRAADQTTQLLYSALPGQYGGSVRVFADTQTWGADANLRCEWFRMLADRNELLAGFRYLDLSESLVINDRSNLPGGVTNSVLDVFRTRNQFYGGQIGLHTRLLNTSGWSLEMIQKFAVGGTRQQVDIFGANTLTGFPDQPTGLLAQRTNSGVFERDKFTAVGELTVNLGYCITSHVRVHVGYNLLWSSSVVRPAQAIDPVLNDSAIRFVANPPQDTTNRRPTFDFGRAADDFWVQGLNLGLTVVY